MKAFTASVLFILIMITGAGFGQTSKDKKLKNVIQSDTSNSFILELGEVPDIDTVVKVRFKYKGEDAVLIEKSWTGDPHYICHYPKTPLRNKKIYSISICCTFKNRNGLFSKVMGLYLSNGEVLSFTVKGIITPRK